jgi:hypothetical protein
MMQLPTSEKVSPFFFLVTNHFLEQNQNKTNIGNNLKREERGEVDLFHYK